MEQMNNNNTNFPNISIHQFQEILQNLKSLTNLYCQSHEEKKLIYNYKTKQFFCPSCLLKSQNLEKSEVLDLKLFLNKNYMKNLLSNLTKCLASKNPKINTSLYKNLQNFLSDFKFTLKRCYEEIYASLKGDYEKASEQIDKIMMGINLDSLTMRSEEAIKALKEFVNHSNNLINIETFTKIVDTHEILENLAEINDPLFEDLPSLMKFQKEKLENLENLCNFTKNSISSLFTLDLDFTIIRSNYNLGLKSIVLKEDLKNLKSNMYYGNVLMDSKNVHQSTVYCFPDYINMINFFQFDSFENFKYFSGHSKQLPCLICGVYNVVFNGYLYARKEPYLSSNTIVRINLESLKIENEKVLEDFMPQETINGWSLYNTHFFLANKEDIFIIYGSGNKETLQTMKLNPVTMEIEKKFEIGLKKLGFDAIFFDGRSINVIQGNKITFKYDLYREIREEMNIIFNAPYSHYNLYYCAQEKSLWALYPKSLSIYELKF